MPDTSQKPPIKSDASPSAATLDASARRPQADDDLALGFECADPWLQIERWGQEDSAQPIQQFN